MYHLALFALLELYLAHTSKILISWPFSYWYPYKESVLQLWSSTSTHETGIHGKSEILHSPWHLGWNSANVLRRHDKDLTLFFSHLVTLRRKLISLGIKATQRKLKHRIVSLTFLSLWQNTGDNVREDGFILDHGFRSVRPQLAGPIEVIIFTKYLFWIVYIFLCVCLVWAHEWRCL